MTNERVLPVVDLTLVNVAADVLSDDDKVTTRLMDLVTGPLFSDAVDAENRWHRVGAPSAETKQIQQQVLRYIQPKDRYAALTSTLLKSLAFYRFMDCQGGGPPKEQQYLERREVVSLPRTQYKKPYIPVPNERATMKFAEEDLWPISLSHQHPFVGIARFPDHVNKGREHPLLVGLDIVVFEGYNPRLYADEDEFLDVFRDYFTPREWRDIQAHHESRLEEFYIRWSMKEAYTKALGVGLGLDYSTLDIVLQRDRNDIGHTGVFASLQENMICAEWGVVEDLSAGQKSGECWGFSFLPLNDESIRGCACVCVGPLRQNVSATLSPFELHVNWTTLQSLVDWHQMGLK